MPGFRDGYRNGFTEATARAAEASTRAAARRTLKQRAAGQEQWQEPQTWDEAPGTEPNPAAAVAELEAALQQRDAELAETTRLVGELKDYAEQLQSRVVELIAGAEPMAKALRLPGVKTFLLQRFHPDKYPDADEHQREKYTDALKTINAAYARAAELQTSG